MQMVEPHPQAGGPERLLLPTLVGRVRAYFEAMGAWWACAHVCGGKEGKNTVQVAHAHIKGQVRSKALHQLLSSHAIFPPHAAFSCARPCPHGVADSFTHPITAFSSSSHPTGVGEDGSRALPHAIAAASVLAGWLRDCPSAVSALLAVPDAMQGIIAAVAHG